MVQDREKLGGKCGEGRSRGGVGWKWWQALLPNSDPSLDLGDPTQVLNLCLFNSGADPRRPIRTSWLHLCKLSYLV